MADQVRTTFPAMGDEGIEGNITNMSGQRSPYTTPVAGKAPAGSDINGPTSGPAKQTEINAEVLGPMCKPQTTLFYPNAEDHDKTGRNTRIMPSATGVADMWAARAEGPVI